MPLTYSQWIWGFEIFDSGPKRNNVIDVDGLSTPPQLNAGVYTVDEFQAEVARALNAGDPGKNFVVSFDAVNTLKFTISASSAFTLNKSTGTSRSVGPWSLLGFDATQGPDPSGKSISSDVAIGAAPTSTAGLWTAAEPLNFTSPVVANDLPSPAGLTHRALRMVQNVSDGASIESVYVTALRKVQVGFRALTPLEQTNMERFLDWCVQGKRFTWQPDKTSANAIKLVLANPGQIGPAFEWLTRSETSYGVLTFLEQVS